MYLSCLYVEVTEPPSSQQEHENTPVVVSVGGWVWVVVLHRAHWNSHSSGTAILPQLRLLDILMSFFIKLSYVLPCNLNRNISPFVLIEGF